MITISHVNKYYGTLQVLHDINLEIKKGEVAVIIGPSGSGKSTLLRCINYLEAYQEGQITLDGDPVGRTVKNGKSMEIPEKALNNLRKRVGMVFQNFNLFPHKKVLDNITMAMIDLRGFSAAEAQRRGMELLRTVGLEDKAHVMPASLSGGQKQRVAIARALAMDPEVMLFDEPTSALDREMVGEVLNVMKSLADSGMTMVIVTHEIEFARQIADKIIFLSDGHIEAMGTPEEIFNNTGNPRIYNFVHHSLGSAV